MAHNFKKAADQRDAFIAALFAADVLRDANSLEPSRAQVDPASFRHQRDQAHESIRELLALYDATKAALRDLHETIVWMDSDECLDAREWPALVRKSLTWLRDNPT